MSAIEDPLRLFSPDGRWCIEVKEEGGEGFLVQVVLDGKTVVEELKTDDSNRVIYWTERQMREVMRRNHEQSGSPR